MTQFNEAYEIKVGIAVSLWNENITNALYEAAVDHLTANGVKRDNIITVQVPGSFELPLGAQYLFEHKDVDGVVCLGCIIQGETRHFEFIANAVSNGIMQLNLDYNAPVAFGVLTTDDMFQAEERSGGKHGNKGVEAASTVLSMIITQLRMEL